LCTASVQHRPVIPVPNPTIANYNASVVNFYKATGSLARFENKNIFFYFEKMLYVAYYNPGVVVVNSKVVGLTPGICQSTSVFKIVSTFVLETTG
jgi:hypothetical protein